MTLVLQPEAWRLCIVTAAGGPFGRSHESVAAAAIEGGARSIQFRDKGARTEALFSEARRVRDMCRAAGAIFIVNDDVELALAVDADGAHVGQDDMPALYARRRLGPARILGVSARTPTEAEAAAEAGADYLGIGPVFEARGSKPDAAAPIGLAGLRAVVTAVNLPCIAIGGINSDNAAEVMRAGAFGVAVISAVAAARDMTAATARLHTAICAASGK